MAELHELLAVEEDLKTQANQAIARLKALFDKGSAKLVGQVRTYEKLFEKDEEFAPEITELGSTVESELTSVSSVLSNWIDAALQKETTNQGAIADLVVNGKTLLTEVPATALLNLEKKLAELKAVYSAIPTLDPAERWTLDDKRGEGVYVSEPRITYRTKKVPKAHVLYEATKEHPAQVQQYAEDIRAGTWTTTLQSGMLTPRDKRERLERLEALMMAVKQARMRANKATVVDVHAGKALLDFINGKL